MFTQGCPERWKPRDSIVSIDRLTVVDRDYPAPTSLRNP